MSKQKEHASRTLARMTHTLDLLRQTPPLQAHKSSTSQDHPRPGVRVPPARTLVGRGCQSARARCDCTARGSSGRGLYDSLTLSKQGKQQQYGV